MRHSTLAAIDATPDDQPALATDPRPLYRASRVDIALASHLSHSRLRYSCGRPENSGSAATGPPHEALDHATAGHRAKYAVLADVVHGYLRPGTSDRMCATCSARHPATYCPRQLQ